MEKQWVVYILECRDGTLYTGITDRLEHRIRAHNEGKGAKYTRGRGPVQLRWYELCEDHSHALRREIQVKRLSRSEKWKIIVDSDKNGNVACGMSVSDV
jgi:putative endonuclease